MKLRLLEKLYLSQPNNLAFTDLCTGVNNRNYFERVIKSRYAKRSVYITVLDIDNFKAANDDKGHLYGDNILRTLAQLLCGTAGVFDFCRYGGDEFVIVHDGSCDLVACAEEFKFVTGHCFSYGTYLKQKHQTVTHALLEADKRLYEMKFLKKGLIR